MFEIEGLSMFPTLNGGYVVGQFVENWSRDIKDNRIYAVISNEVQDGLIKRCINQIDKYNNLICKSDNKKKLSNSKHKSFINQRNLRTKYILISTYQIQQIFMTG